MKMLDKSALLKAWETFGLNPIGDKEPCYGDLAGGIIAIGEINAAMYRYSNRGNDDTHDVRGYMAALRAVIDGEPDNEAYALLRLLITYRFHRAYELQQRFTTVVDEGGNPAIPCLERILNGLLCMINGVNDIMDHSDDPAAMARGLSMLNDLAAMMVNATANVLLVVPDAKGA